MESAAPDHFVNPLLGTAGGKILVADDRVGMDAPVFAAQVAGLAETLSDSGVSSGDVVAAMLPNRIEIIIAMYAAWQLSAAFMPINPALTTSEATHQLTDSAAKVVLVDEASREKLSGVDVKKLPLDGWTASQTDTHAIAPRHDDLALLIYTSGTTGKPKGVMLDHANIEVMTRSIRQALRLGPADHSLLAMPLFHVNALLVSVLSPLVAGGSVRILPGFDRATFWERVRASGATYFSGVPAMFILLSEKSGAIKTAPDLRFAICGAAPMPAAAIATFEEQYGVPILEGYGLTESTVGATLNPLDGPRRAGSVGKAMPDIEVRIIDENCQPLPLGELGEVAICGGNVMRGYLNQMEATIETIVDGWLRTGDMGRLDSEGWLTLAGRKKDIIIRGGENIYPTEVEHALIATTLVTDAAVVGQHDPVMGEVPVAFVVPADGEGPVELDAKLSRLLAERLSRFKVPTAFHFVDEMPRNSTGKTDKPALRARLDKALQHSVPTS